MLRSSSRQARISPYQHRHLADSTHRLSADLLKHTFGAGDCGSPRSRACFRTGLRSDHLIVVSAMLSAASVHLGKARKAQGAQPNFKAYYTNDATASS